MVAISIIKIDVCGIALDMDFIPVVDIAWIIVQTMTISFHLVVVFATPDVSMAFDFSKR